MQSNGIQTGGTRASSIPAHSVRWNALRRLTPVKGVSLEAKKLARFLRHPIARMRHRTALRDVVRNPALTGLMDEKSGYGFIPRDVLPHLDAVIQFCRQLLDERRDRPDLWPIPARKHHDYPLPILQPLQKEDAPPIFDLVLSDPILQIASEYLGEVPVLQKINVWWTPKNQEMQGSQFYHRDTLSWSERQAKFFVNITDVDEDAGPFTFLPADISTEIVRKFGYPPERVSDEVIFQTASPSDQIAAVGPAGTTCAVDSSRCFHFGSRCRGKERLVLQFNFRPCLSPDGSWKARKVGSAFAQELMSDPVRRMVYPVIARH